MVDHYEELTRALNKVNAYVDVMKNRLSNKNYNNHCVLRDYQIEGHNWLITLYENGMNGILADEMGLGKTLQVISALASLVELGVRGPFLVICPLSLLTTWLDQFSVFAPDLPCIVYHGQQRCKLRNNFLKKHFIRKTGLIKPFPNFDNSELKKEFSLEEPDLYWTYPIILTSFDIAMRDFKYFYRIPFKVLVIDEGHRLKNPLTKFYKLISKFVTSLRVLLTGTPLQNRLSELWSLLHFILPEIFTSLKMFEHLFDPVNLSNKFGQNELISAQIECNLITKLHEIIHAFMLRRTKDRVNLILPPKREILLKTTMMALEHRLYNYIMGHKLVFKTDESNAKNSSNSQINSTVQTSNIIPHDCETNSNVNEQIDRRLTRQANVLWETSLSSGHFSEAERRPGGDPEGSFRRKRLDQNSNLNVDFCVHPSTTTTSIDVPNLPNDANFQFLNDLNLSNRFMLLRRIVNHPYLVIEHPFDNDNGAINEKYVESILLSSSKTALLDRLLKRLINKHKMIVFSQWTMVLDLLGQLFDIRNWPYVRLDGTTRLEDRQEAIRRFNNESVDQLPLFLISTKAGGYGLNLQSAADTVFIYDSDWNPQTDLQAQDRCHRIGQNKPVLVIRLVTGNSIDEMIYQRAQIKRGLERLLIFDNQSSDDWCSNDARPLNYANSGDNTRQFEFDASLNSAVGSKLKSIFEQTDYYRTFQCDPTISDNEIDKILDRSDLNEMWRVEQESKVASSISLSSTDEIMIL